MCKGQRDVTMATNFGTKTKIVTRDYLGVSQSKQHIFDSEGLGDVAMATKFGKKNEQNNTKTGITSVLGERIWFSDSVYAISEFN